MLSLSISSFFFLSSFLLVDVTASRGLGAQRRHEKSLAFNDLVKSDTTPSNPSFANEPLEPYKNDSLGGIDDFY